MDKTAEVTAKGTPRIEVTIVGNHPHCGERGYLKVENGKPVTILVGNGLMFEVILEDCQHGTGRCYAASMDMRLNKQYEKLWQLLTGRKESA